MGDEKIIAAIIPYNACPNCRHKSFIVMQIQVDAFVTDGDGNICATEQKHYNAIGKCLNCGKEYDMMPTPNGFNPMGKIKSILNRYNGVIGSNCTDNISLDNPMEIDGGE